MTLNDRDNLVGTKGIYAVFHNQLKLLRTRGEGGTQRRLFDTFTEPNEAPDLAARRAAFASDLASHLVVWLDGDGPAQRRACDPMSRFTHETQPSIGESAEP